MVLCNMDPIMIDQARRNALIRKYNRPGPRYTSYPTALQFSTEPELDDLLSASRESRQPLSLYFHLPFCESLCWFCACTTVITRDRKMIEHYLGVLLKELDLVGVEMGGDTRRVEQIHLGGGSPSFMEADQLDRLLAAVRSRFSVDDDAECSAELDPRTLSREKVEVLAKHGFRRASFGVQDLNPAVQKAVHRVQPDELNRESLNWVREAGFSAVNIDLIYGLPGQTVESFAETLEAVLDYDPDRLAVFAYAHVPWVAPAQKILDRKPLPGPDVRLEMLMNAIDFLTSRGYRYIGMDHFAKETDELTKAMDSGTLHRNFQGYSTRGGADLWGFGMSAISQNENAYRQNFKGLKEYNEAVEANRLPLHRGYCMTMDDRVRKKAIMSLMCRGELDFDRLGEECGVDFSGYFRRELESLADMESDGLLLREPGRIKLSSMGHLLLRNVAMRFDAYLKEGEKRHAKTI